MNGQAEASAGTNPVVKWLGIAGAVVVGLAGLVEGAKKLDDAFHLWTPKPSEVPKISQYDSPRVDGGHTAEEFCNPQLDAYAAQYPDFNIEMRILPSKGDRDWKQHVTYVFHCVFIPTPKIK